MQLIPACQPVLEARGLVQLINRAEFSTDWLVCPLRAQVPDVNTGVRVLNKVAHT